MDKELGRSETAKNLEKRLHELEEEREKLKNELTLLKQSTSPEAVFPTRHAGVALPDPTSEHINLFRSYFRGREDLYAQQWISRKTQRKGFSPVCKNKWNRSVCRLPEITCPECQHRELSPLDEEVLKKHLAGFHTIGVYPMLPDETCHFLAVDFDGKGWAENVFAFKGTCGKEGIPVVVERSSSGNGAHAWIFFEEAVQTKLARQMGSFLITETMSARYQLGMESYDRLFPNQDNLPKGGFGNLIALPFQKNAAASGNTVFINESGEPYKDQWEFLSSIKKLPRAQVEALAQNAVATGRVTGVRASFDVEDEELPWRRLPSGKSRSLPAIQGLPEKVEVVIANRLFMKTDGLPSVFLNRMKRLAAFQNPEFYRRQNMRLSTSFVPRIVCCSEILDGYLALPRGCIDDLTALGNEYGVLFEIKDERLEGKRIACKFTGELNDEQQKAAQELLKHDTGILVAPPGMGKTVLGIYAIAKRKRNTLVLVHRKPLLEQWRTQLSAFLNIEPDEIGEIHSSKNKPTNTIDVAMLQSLHPKGVVNDVIENYGQVIVDECHHIPAVSFERVLAQSKAKYVLGLTATPYRRDGHQPIIHMQCGVIRYKIAADINENMETASVVLRETGFTCNWADDSKIHDLWPLVIHDEPRNNSIASDVGKAVSQGRFPLILTERREHLQMLEEKLRGSIEQLVVLHGGVSPKARREMLEALRCIIRRKGAGYSGKGAGHSSQRSHPPQ